MDNQGSSAPLTSFCRSILGLRSEQVHSMETPDSNNVDLELESFQKLVFDRFNDLLISDADEFLSIAWIKKLLEAFIGCQEDFRFILCKNRLQLSKQPIDKLLFEYFERAIKALDICNATRDGIEKVRLWQKHLEIILCALDSQQRLIGEGQFRRARKALMDLSILMLDEKETGSSFSQRNRSFGRHGKGKDHHLRHPGHSRSLSWSVSQTWSATKQLQAIANNMVPPRGTEIAATNGLAIPIFTMTVVLVFVLWVLVATIPCQDRSLHINFSIPRQFSWGTTLNLLHAKIMDESKNRDRRSSSGLLREIYQIEKYVHHMTDLVDSAQFPLTEDQKEQVRQGVHELSLVCEICKNQIDPLERCLREAFRKIMNCRTEGLEFLGGANQS